jgi:hypothetical protein
LDSGQGGLAHHAGDGVHPAAQLGDAMQKQEQPQGETQDELAKVLR